MSRGFKFKFSNGRLSGFRVLRFSDNLFSDFEGRFSGGFLSGFWKPGFSDPGFRMNFAMHWMFYVR